MHAENIIRQLNMENPFVFGKAAEGSYFTDRKEDARRLTANLTHGINTILISPRRWGKTSLVKKVISDIDSPDIKIVFVDVFQCKSESEFYHAFATAMIKQTSSKLEEWVEMAKTFLSNISPKLGGLLGMGCALSDFIIASITGRMESPFTVTSRNVSICNVSGRWVSGGMESGCCRRAARSIITGIMVQNYGKVCNRPRDLRFIV